MRWGWPRTEPDPTLSHQAVPLSTFTPSSELAVNSALGARSGRPTLPPRPPPAPCQGPRSTPWARRGRARPGDRQSEAGGGPEIPGLGRQRPAVRPPEFDCQPRPMFSPRGEQLFPAQTKGSLCSPGTCPGRELLGDRKGSPTRGGGGGQGRAGSWWLPRPAPDGPKAPAPCARPGARGARRGARGPLSDAPEPTVFILVGAV